jgi:hypothetical protein
MVSKKPQTTEELKEILSFMEEIVVTIDKIGSGFDESNRAASALLLFFNQCSILDKLSRTRKYLYEELEGRLSAEEFDEWIEKDSVLWSPPYEKTEEEILKLINYREK